MTNLLFSIVIPTFNRSNKIIRAIKSIIKNNNKSFEIIVVDDHSTDNTRTVLKKNNNIKIKKIFLKENYGPGYARNKAIKIASGKWVVFLDSDDIFFKNKLFKISKIKNLENYDLIVHDNLLYNSKTKKIKRIYNGTFLFLLKFHMINLSNIISLSSSIIKRDFLINNNIYFNETKKFVGIEDYIFWLDVLNKGAKVFFYKKFLGCNFISNDNLTDYNKSSIAGIRQKKNAVKFFANKNKIYFNDKKYLELNLFLYYIKYRKIKLLSSLLKKTKNLKYLLFNSFILNISKRLYQARIG